MYLIDNSEIDYTAYPYDKTIDMNITPMKRMYEMACKWVKIGYCKKAWTIGDTSLDYLINMAKLLNSKDGLLNLRLRG